MSTSLLVFSTLSSPKTETGVTVAASPASNSSASGSSSGSVNASSTDGGNGSQPSGGNDNYTDPFSNGPSVYLYGFLATLVLIFLVSLAVAWKGYRARRQLRARIDEAIAQGVYIPGYTGEDYANLRRGRGTISLPRPVIYDNWIESKEKTVYGWDITPTAIAAIRPIVPPPPRPAKVPRTSIFHKIMAPIKEFWFVQPPQGAEPGQLQGRPNPSTHSNPNADTRPEGRNTSTVGGEKEFDLSNAEGLSVAVLIAMPDRSNPVWDSAWDGRGKGKSVSRPTSSSYSSPLSYSPLAHFSSTATPSQPSSSYPRVTGAPSTSEGAKEEDKELPELVMGVAAVGIERPLPVALENQEAGSPLGGGEADPTIGSNSNHGPRLDPSTSQ